MKEMARTGKAGTGSLLQSVKRRQVSFSSVSDCVVYNYCDVHAVGRLFTAVAMQRNNGRDQRFPCGPFQ
jgi:hypothetical protein